MSISSIYVWIYLNSVEIEFERFNFRFGSSSTSWSLFDPYTSHSLYFSKALCYWYTFSSIANQLQGIRSSKSLVFYFRIIILEGH